MRIVAAYLLCATHAFAPPTPSLRAPTALHAENPIRKYGGSVVLGLLGIQSIRDLILEVPKLGSDQADYFGTAIDVAFTAFVATQLATQSGVAQPDGGEPSADLAGLDFKITMSVGRESGTWMDKEFDAASDLNHASMAWRGNATDATHSSVRLRTGGRRAARGCCCPCNVNLRATSWISASRARRRSRAATAGGSTVMAGPSWGRAAP